MIAVRRRYGPIVCRTALVFAALGPFFLTELELFTASRAGILALWAVSLNLLLGQTGMVSFAHAAFFGIGAYSVALLWLHLGWSAVLGIPLAVLAGAALAMVSGVLALRAVRLYFALLTLALSQLAYAVVFQWYAFTRGDNGIHGIEVPAILSSPVTSYYFVVALAVLGITALRMIARSPFGAALLAIRENRTRAQFLGLDVRRYELAAFTLAGAFAALAGSLFAVFYREAYPSLMFWAAAATPIFMILIGGMHRFWGPVVGAIVYVLLEETVTRQTLYPNLVLGAVLLTFVLLMPEGLAGVAQSVRTRLQRRKPDKEAEPQPSRARVEVRR